MKTGQIIKSILIEKGKKQVWLANELGISEALLSNMLKSDIKFGMLLKICKSLDITVEELAKRAQKKEMSLATGKKHNSSQKSDNVT